jgi:hypothetical protein
MAGKPNTRIKKLTATLTDALASGERDMAQLAYAEIRRVASEAGMEMPALPQEATEMWLQISEGVKPRDVLTTETKLTDATRRTLLRAGDLAAGHMLRLMEETNLFGPLGIVPVRDQVAILSTVMGRAFGGMPTGAQKVGAPLQPGEAEEPQQVGATLSMMIRQKQQPPQPAMRVVRQDIEDVPEGDPDLDGE